MIRLCWAGLVLILIAGCKPEVPEDILQPEMMVPVLCDMHIADGYVSAIPVPDSARRVGASYYNAIYKKYNIDSARYTRSMNYYYDHVNLLSEIYKDVTADLKKSKDSIDKIQAQILKKEEAAKKLKRDSADKANPKLVIARADSLKKFKADSLRKVRKDSTDRVKLEKKAEVPAIKKAKRDSAEKARLKSVKKADAPKKVI